MENRPATMAVSPSMASPKFSATPWAKYSPSPSHASPSAGILKRKCDTPSSTEVGRIIFLNLFFVLCVMVRHGLVVLPIRLLQHGKKYYFLYF